MLNSKENHTIDAYDQHSDYRYSSRGGSVYLVVESFLWLSSATFGLFGQTSFAILLLIIGGMFIHPISLAFTRMLGFPHLYQTNRLPILNTWLALMIPLGLPLVFMAIAGGRINFFYPAFSVLIGAHWLPFTYVYGMKSFAVFAAIFVAIGILFAFVFTGPFSTCGFVVGTVLLIFAVINFLLVRGEVQKV